MCGRIVWPGAVRGEAQWSYQSFIVYDAVVACFGGQPNSFGQVGCTQVSLLHPHLLPATPAARRKPLPNRLRSPSWSPGCGSALGLPACRALQCTPPDSALKPSLHPQLTDPPTACPPARPPARPPAHPSAYAQLSEVRGQLLELGINPRQMATYCENHDTNRFLTVR